MFVYSCHSFENNIYIIIIKYSIPRKSWTKSSEVSAFAGPEKQLLALM